MQNISELCSGIILAGGLSTRLGGRNKAMIQVDGKRILDRIYETYLELFDEIILVTNSPLEYLNWNVLSVADIFPIRSSLTGIHAGLFYSSRPFAFISACDMPFLRREIISLLISSIGQDKDIVIPETEKGLEPLCAVYSKSCLTTINKHLQAGNLKIQEVFRKTQIRKIPEIQIRQADSELVSLININTPEDLERLTSCTDSYPQISHSV